MSRMVTRLLPFAVVVALVAGGIAWWLNRPDETRVTATKEAIAAVTVEVLDISPSSYNTNPGWDVGEPLGVEIRWHPGGSDDAHYLHVRVEPSRPADTHCSESSRCDTWDAGDGTFYLRWQEEAPEEDPGILVLTLSLHGEDRTVVYAGQEITGDPRDQDDLPIAVETFQELLLDDRFSETTTREMVDTELPKWPEDAELGDTVRATAETIARWVAEADFATPRSARPFTSEEYGSDAVGAEFRFAEGVRMTLVLVPALATEEPGCPARFRCRERDGVLQGWRPGRAIGIGWLAGSGGYWVGTVVAKGIDGFPKMSYQRGGGIAGDVFSGVASWQAPHFSLLTTRAYDDEARPPRWWRAG